MSRTKDFLMEHEQEGNYYNIDEETAEIQQIEDELHKYEIKLEKQIRNRKSYKDFRDFLLMIRKENPSTNNEKEILTACIIAVSFRAKKIKQRESLALLLKDAGVI